jgi:hypothetical protein
MQIIFQAACGMAAHWAQVFATTEDWFQLASQSYPRQALHHRRASSLGAANRGDKARMNLHRKTSARSSRWAGVQDRLMEARGELFGQRQRRRATGDRAS